MPQESTFIDFIRSAEAEPGENDSTRSLSLIGIRQASAFGQTRRAAGESYAIAIDSGATRAFETLNRVIDMNTRDMLLLRKDEKPALYSVLAMYDPWESDTASLERQQAFQLLGELPLIEYYRHCEMALTTLASAACHALRPFIYPASRGNSGNVLIVGHQIYTPAIIHTAYRRQLRRDMVQRLLYGPPLKPCAGYRLVFNSSGHVGEMLDLPAPVLATA